MALDEQRLAQVLNAFRNQRELRHEDLPEGVGPRTMEMMVELGYAEVVDPTVGKQSKGYAWRRSKSAPRKKKLFQREPGFISK